MDVCRRIQLEFEKSEFERSHFVYLLFTNMASTYDGFQMKALIDNSLVDFGRRSNDYSTHRPGFPPSFYDRLENFLKWKDLRVLDVGTGNFRLNCFVIL